MPERAFVGSCLALAGLLAMAAPVQAQNHNPFSFEVRGGLTMPTGDFGDGVEMGPAFNADAFFNISDQLSIYGGWGYHGFGSEGGSDETDLTSTGFDLGAKFLFARWRQALPWVRGGATFHKLELDGGAESDRGVGLELGAGVDIPLGRIISLTPAVRYYGYSAEFPVAAGLATTESDVSYVIFDFGFHFHF